MYRSRISNLYKDRRQEGTTSVRQAQLIELHLLEVFKYICESAEIPFWLDGGTLIGALRHGGFIPWDDDLDVYILKKDFKRFIETAKKMLPDDVYLEMSNQNLRMENHITRLRDNYSWGLVRRDKRLLVNDHHGVCIDIFTLRECSRRNILTKKLLRKLSSHYGWYKRAHYNEVTLWNWLKKWVLGGWVLFLKTMFELTQLLGTARYLVEDTWFVNEKLWWPREWLVHDGEPQRLIKFEDTMMPIPYEAEKMLAQQFGDWKRLPPEENRVGYLSVCLPTTPCFHPSAMDYPQKVGVKND